MNGEVKCRKCLAAVSDGVVEAFDSRTKIDVFFGKCENKCSNEGPVLKSA